MPSDHPVVTCNIPNGAAARAQSLVAGLRYPKIMVGPAQRELDSFIALLQSLGIVVRRPEPTDHKKRFSTPYWSSRGFCNSCPRDAILVVCNEIIETPMVWPCRYFETLSYCPIFKDYFRRGALDGRSQTADHGRAVRSRHSSAGKRGTHHLHPDGIRARLRRGGFRSLRTRPVRHSEQRNQRSWHRKARPTGSTERDRPRRIS